MLRLIDPATRDAFNLNAAISAALGRIPENLIPLAPSANASKRREVSLTWAK
jgi:hypothetical protein